MTRVDEPLTILALLLAASTLTAGDRCEYVEPFLPSSFLVEKGNTGYAIRISRPEARGGVGHPAQIYSVGEQLAREANAMIVYLFGATERDVPATEWRGDTPLAALQAFAAAGGLEVEVPQPNVWVIGPPDYRQSSAVTISVAPAFPEEQSSLWGRDTAEVEEALLRALPVRDAGGSRGEVAVRVSYYWIPEEAVGTLLIVHCLQHPGAPGDIGDGFFRAFKVRLRRDGRGVAVECLWDTGDAEEREPTGWLIPEIAEDLDGDGYRDFVFFAEGERGHAVLSGKDGHRLLTFSGDEFAVEKKAAGPKRVAVRDLWDDSPLSKLAYQEALAAGASKEQLRGFPDGPLVLSYREDTRQFAFDKALLAAANTSPAPADDQQRRTDGPRQLLARAVGGAAAVRVYLLAPGARIPVSDCDQVPAYGRYFRLQQGGRELAKLYEGRVVVDYKSAGYLEKERQRQERLRQQRQQ